MQTVTRESAVARLDGFKREWAREIVEQVFNALRWTTVESGMVQDVSWLDSWKHRTLEDIEADLAYLEISRADILTALSTYISSDELKTDELDWLFLNLLVYAEYLATTREVRKRLVGVDRFIKSAHPPSAEHVPGVSSISGRPWHAAAAIGLTIASAFVHPLLAIGIATASVYTYARRAKAMSSVDRILCAMLRTYASFNTVHLSWAHVIDELEQSRRAGAIWDASLFRLAELRSAT